MIVSLGELADTARKAVSGTGHCFGIAEEMGYAIRSLCELGLPGANELVNALQRFGAVAPRIERGETVTVVSTNHLPLPALSLAPSIGELLVALRKPVTVDSLTQPLLLIPFVVRAAASLKSTSVQWTTGDGDAVIVNVADNGVSMFASDASSFSPAIANEVRCQRGVTQTVHAPLYKPAELGQKRQAAIAGGCAVDEIVWEDLLAFAHNTYVPISEQSRIRGAGAGLTDND